MKPYVSVGVDPAHLQDLLDAVPAPLEPLDIGALDGFLCGVLLQPSRLPASRWLHHAIDAEGRPAPVTADVAKLEALVMQRHDELDRAIEQRRWFDPWVFEPDAGEAPSETVRPWVAGFALAMESFPGLMSLDASALTEPLALLYRHLDPDDLEDAEELLEEIEMLEPPAELSDAVEELVRATLLLADISRPQRRATPPRPQRGAYKR